MRDKQIEDLKDYKYGFSTDIENVTAPKGLNENVVRFISDINLITFSLKPFGALTFSISVEKPYL